MVSHFFTSKMSSLERSAQAALRFHTASVRTCLWWHRCSNFLLLFKLGGCFLTMSFWVLYLYWLLVIYQICILQTHPRSLWLVFVFITMFLKEYRIFTSKSNLTVFFFYNLHCLWPTKSLPNSNRQRSSYTLSFRNFILLVFHLGLWPIWVNFYNSETYWFRLCFANGCSNVLHPIYSDHLFCSSFHGTFIKNQLTVTESLRIRVYISHIHCPQVSSLSYFPAYKCCTYC